MCVGIEYSFKFKIFFEYRYKKIKINTYSIFIVLYRYKKDINFFIIYRLGLVVIMEEKSNKSILMNIL